MPDTSGYLVIVIKVGIVLVQESLVTGVQRVINNSEDSLAIRRLWQ